MEQYLAPQCAEDHCESCFNLNCTCSCHLECDICGKPINIGDHTHPDDQEGGSEMIYIEAFKIEPGDMVRADDGEWHMVEGVDMNDTHAFIRFTDPMIQPLKMPITYIVEVQPF